MDNDALLVLADIIYRLERLEKVISRLDDIPQEVMEIALELHTTGIRWATNGKDRIQEIANSLKDGTWQ